MQIYHHNKSMTLILLEELSFRDLRINSLRISNMLIKLKERVFNKKSIKHHHPITKMNLDKTFHKEFKWLTLLIILLRKAISNSTWTLKK